MCGKLIRGKVGKQGYQCRGNSLKLKKREKLRITFTPNGKREVVPRELALSLIVVYWLLLLPQNK